MTESKRFVLPAVLSLLAISALAGRATHADFNEAPPADWLAAPMGWIVDHSPLYSNNENFKVARDRADGFLTEWRYRPETETLEVRFSPVNGGCPGLSIWSMSTRVERPDESVALQRSAFASPERDRSRPLLRRRTVRGTETVSGRPEPWIYTGQPAPAVQPERQADGSWVLRRAFDGTDSVSDDRLAVCPAPYR